MTKPLFFPALDEGGWVTSDSKVGDYIFSHFFVSDYSQSQIYHGQISSLPWILQTYQNDIRQAIATVESTLRVYFERYFSNVVVEASQIDSTENPGQVIMSIYVSYTDRDGKTVVLGKSLNVMDSKILKIKTINNG